METVEPEQVLERSPVGHIKHEKNAVRVFVKLVPYFVKAVVPTQVPKVNPHLFAHPVHRLYAVIHPYRSNILADKSLFAVALDQAAFASALVSHRKNFDPKNIRGLLSRRKLQR